MSKFLIQFSFTIDTRSSSPWNFSWVMEDKLAAMSGPSSLANLEFLFENNIRHLITLSKECMPPIQNYPKMEWTLISVEEFHAPCLDDINKFISICEECFAKNQVHFFLLPRLKAINGYCTRIYWVLY